MFTQGQNTNLQKNSLNIHVSGMHYAEMFRDIKQISVRMRLWSWWAVRCESEAAESAQIGCRLFFSRLKQPQRARLRVLYLS